MNKQLMKSINIALFACLLLLFTGCIKEDRDNCENKLILEFEHKDKLGKDIFLKAIDKVDVFIFNESNKLIYKQKITKSTLTNSRVTTMKLPSGKYHIVSWANANDNSVFEGTELGTDLSELRLKNPTLNNNKIVDGDPLYYYATDVDLSTITLPNGGTLRKKIPFCRAHIKIEVYIKGFGDSNGTSPDLTPLLELTNLSTDYDFDMVTTKDKISAVDKTIYEVIDGNKFAVADFYPTVFSEETDTDLLVRKQSDNSVVTTVSLKDFIKKNNIDLNSCQQTIIPIYIEYKSTEVVVSVPSWDSVPVKPEL